MAKEKKEQRYHQGIAIDSEEEYAFLIWLEELIERGFVESVKRADSISLSESVVVEYTEEKQMKTKIKLVDKSQKLLEKHIYTPEFEVFFSKLGLKRMIHDLRFDEGKVDKLFISNGQVVIFEIKPEWDQNNMERLFKINQKWIYDKCKIFVNLIKPFQLFEKTFTPKAWLTTPTGKKRVIHWQVRSLDEYLLEVL